MDRPARRGLRRQDQRGTPCGTLPDVVNVSPDLVAPLAKAGLALDLDKSAAKYRSEYLPGAWASHEIPGMTGTYAFPWYLNTGPLFYNKSLFTQAGLNADQPPKTYDELFAQALQLAKKTDGKVATLANVPTVEDFGRYGVELMNKAGTAFAFNDAKGIELLTKYKELYDAKALDPQALTATPESSGKKFLTGAVAMNPGSALDLDNFKKQAPTLYKNIGITDQITSTGHVNMYVMGVMVNSRPSTLPPPSPSRTTSPTPSSRCRSRRRSPSSRAPPVPSTTRTSPRRTAPTRRGCGSPPPSP